MSWPTSAIAASPSCRYSCWRSSSSHCCSPLSSSTWGEDTETALQTVDWLIWALFAADYLVGLALAPHRWRYVRTEWLNLLLVALPFLRPLRVLRSTRALRLLRLTRVAAAVGRAGQGAVRLLVRHQLHYALLATLVLVVSCAALVFAVEADAGGTIDSFADALWWATTTVTTVGYGDAFPVTAAGRGIAALLMIAGIALFGVVTANLAAFMLERDGAQEAEPDVGKDSDHAELVALLHEIRSRLEALERKATSEGEAATPLPTRHRREQSVSNPGESDSH